MLHLGDHLYTWRQLECERNGALQAHDPRDRGNLVSIEHIVATALSPKASQTEWGEQRALAVLRVARRSPVERALLMRRGEVLRGEK